MGVGVAVGAELDVGLGVELAVGIAMGMVVVVVLPTPVRVVNIIFNDNNVVNALTLGLLHRVLSKFMFPRDGSNLFRQLRVQRSHQGIVKWVRVHAIKIGLAYCFASEVQLF